MFQVHFPGQALLLALAVAGTASAQSPWLPRVAKALQSSPGWKVDLQWTVKPPAGSLAKPRTTSGTLHLADSNRFRFESEAMRALSDGSTAWQYSPATGQVLVQSLSRLDASQLPGTLLAQALSGSETSSSRETLSGRKTVRLELAVGKGALARFSRASLWADVDDLRPVRLLVADAQGTETIWDLATWKRWKPQAREFAWKPVPGAETVDLRD